MKFAYVTNDTAETSIRNHLSLCYTMWNSNSWQWQMTAYPTIKEMLILQ
jgi:hypothetical protein